MRKCETAEIIYFSFSIQKNLYFVEKAFAKECFWFTLYKQPDLLAAEVFFKLYISQRYVRNFEWNKKNSVCIGVKNFANL